MCCEYDTYSHSSDLAEQHAIDNILTEKARKCITASDSNFREIRYNSLSNYEDQNEDWYDLKSKKKKKKENTSYSKTQRHPAYSIVAWHSGVIGRWRDGSRQDSK